jgi:hypothetical protein
LPYSHARVDIHTRCVLTHDYIALGDFCAQNYERDNQLETGDKTVHVPEVDIDFEPLLYLKRVLFREHSDILWDITPCSPLIVN